MKARFRHSFFKNPNFRAARAAPVQTELDFAKAEPEQAEKSNCAESAESVSVSAGEGRDLAVADGKNAKKAGGKKVARRGR
jgi:hypothetical protein